MSEVVYFPGIDVVFCCCCCFCFFIFFSNYYLLFFSHDGVFICYQLHIHKFFERWCGRHLHYMERPYLVEIDASTGTGACTYMLLRQNVSDEYNDGRCNFHLATHC